MGETIATYPGEGAEPSDLIALAGEYRKAAHALMSQGRRAQPHSWAPARLAAIHAIELYLNAYLLARGCGAPAIRGMQHNIAQRWKAADDLGLRLRKRTAAHLQALSERREYLVVRYDPKLAGSQSALNRVTATLDELARKVVPQTSSENA